MSGISKKILRFGISEGMSWSIFKAADATWDNGCSEAIVKLVKRSSVRYVGEIILTFSKLQTAFFEIANMLNERPIKMKFGNDINMGCYLSTK